MRSKVGLQGFRVARALRKGSRREGWGQAGRDGAKIWGFVLRALEATERALYLWDIGCTQRCVKCPISQAHYILQGLWGSEVTQPTGAGLSQVRTKDLEAETEGGAGRPRPQFTFIELSPRDGAQVFPPVGTQ